MNNEIERVDGDVLPDENEEQLSRLILKCWADEAFKEKLLVDTMKTLKEEGVDTPEGVTVKAVENTNSLFHLVIPERNTEISNEELEEIVGGRGGIFAVAGLAYAAHDQHTDTNYRATPGGWRHPTDEEKHNSPRAKLGRWLQGKVWNKF
ncbi:NHLP leader peptide family natural product precursor [Candidatus Methylospira mobilis]|uniref:NHLP leader peptide family natural product n=1 Tax=Candidatus Methylospira mobilis TaxID=1808979 RepID=A0A5Q0BLY8_9GAMM|nr:NHLP leader peptide family RiPP precursor [Candidatus Methylospira mobilis]QFY43234.1 NHLP leader peptide family natural product precursor [Candidatus Methylospira mobilis]